MGLFRRQKLFVPRAGDRFEVNLADDAKQGILSLAEELEELQSTDRPETRRLFPTAYPDDPERDAGYQIFARDQLIEKRRAAVEVIRQTADAEMLTAEELGAWMGVLNDLRLVLGTMLDVSEDDDDVDFDRPDADSQLLYRYLGELVHTMVEALTTALPEPTDEDWHDAIGGAPAEDPVGDGVEDDLEDEAGDPQPDPGSGTDEDPDPTD